MTKNITKNKEAKPEAAMNFLTVARHFYRTGVLPNDQPIDGLSSPFVDAFGDKSPFPFIHEGEKIERSPLWLTEVLNKELLQYQKGARGQFQQQLQDLIRGINQLLGLNHQPSNDEETYDFASELIAFEKLTELIPSEKPMEIDERRRERLQAVLADITAGLKEHDKKKATLAYGALSHYTMSFTQIALISLKEKNKLEQVKALLKSQMDAFTQLTKAIRIASLEIDQAYDPGIHDAFFEDFNWYRLSAQERQCFHPVVALLSTKEVTEDFEGFNHLLRSNWPIRILVICEDFYSEAQQVNSWADASHQFKPELFLEAFVQRNTYVFQGTEEHPELFAEAVHGGLERQSPVVWHWLMDREQGNPGLGAAASRAHYFPTISYDPDGIEGNNRVKLWSPQQLSDWTLVQWGANANEENSQTQRAEFTYADYKALFSVKRKELLIIPKEHSNQSFIPLTDYMDLKGEAIYGKLPYLTLLNSTGEEVKALVPNQWVVSCYERLQFAKFMNDLSQVDQGDTGEEPQNKERQSAGIDENELREQVTAQTINHLLNSLLKE